MNNILILFSVISMGMFTGYSNAQNVANCDCTITKDEFTGKTVKETGRLVLRNHSGHGNEISFKKSDTSYFLIFSSYGSAPGSSPQIAGRTDALIFRLPDSSKVTMYPLDILSMYTSVKSSDHWRINTIYNVSGTDLEKLSKYRIIKYRLFYNKNYYDDYVKYNSAQAIMLAAQCILK
jgi:hypothetical protein